MQVHMLETHVQQESRGVNEGGREGEKEEEGGVCDWGGLQGGGERCITFCQVGKRVRAFL